MVLVIETTTTKNRTCNRITVQRELRLAHAFREDSINANPDATARRNGAKGCCDRKLARTLLVSLTLGPMNGLHI
jgi:hypothetical protein